MIPPFALEWVAGLLGPKFGKFANVVIYAVLAIVLIASLFGLRSCYDHKVITAHDAKQDASNAKADTKANSNATNQIIVDNDRRTTEAQEAQHAIDHAKQVGANPRDAYYDCVRKQQSARHNGQPSPSC